MASRTWNLGRNPFNPNPQPHRNGFLKQKQIARQTRSSSGTTLAKGHGLPPRPDDAGTHCSIAAIIWLRLAQWALGWKPQSRLQATSCDNRHG